MFETKSQDENWMGEAFLRIILAITKFKPFPNKSWFLRVCCTSFLKTPREKKKLLVTILPYTFR